MAYYIGSVCLNLLAGIVKVIALSAPQANVPCPKTLPSLDDISTGGTANYSTSGLVPLSYRGSRQSLWVRNDVRERSAFRSGPINLCMAWGRPLSSKLKSSLDLRVVTSLLRAFLLRGNGVTNTYLGHSMFNDLYM